MDWKSIPYMFREISGVDNVVGLGRGHKWVRGENTGKEAVLVLVKKKYPNGDLRRASLLPKKIAGVFTDVLEVGDIRLLADARTELQRPAHPGISIGHYKVSAGTFGAVVRDRNTDEVLMLSNNHVLANLSNGADDRAKVGDDILQPGSYDGGDPKSMVIGQLKRFVPLYSEISKPRCKIAKAFEGIFNKCISLVQPHYQIQVLRETEKVNLVDCAVAAPVSPDLISPDIVEVGTVAGTKKPQVGMTVKKSGRSSGVTFSIILATDVTVRVGVGKEEYGVFADQILAGPMSMPGDSGSLVLSEDNHAVGLLFAGSEQATMFSQIDLVLDALNISLQ